MKPSRTVSKTLIHGAVLGTFAATSTTFAVAVPQYFNAAGAPANWNTSTANWGNGPGGPYSSLWTNGNNALFEGTGSTVNVGTVSAASLTFNTAGYALNGGTVTMTAGTINANQPVTISSELAGTGGVVLASDQYTGPAAAVTSPLARNDGTYVIGNVFSLGNAVTLTALGVYAGGATSGTLGAASTAGVWNSAGTLIASVTVPAGTPISADRYAYVDITPVVLPAATGYTMGAQAGPGFNVFFDNAGNAALTAMSGLGMSITNCVYKGAGATFGQPTGGGGLSPGRWGAANLKITLNGLTGLPNQPVTYTGQNTYTGDTQISGSLIFDSATPQTWSQPLTGPGTVTQTGSGTLTLTAASNAYTGSTIIDAGSTLVIGGAGTLGGGSYAPGISNNGTLSIDTSENQILGGSISGTGELIKNGSGTLSLSGAVSNYSGNTTINAGTVELTGSTQLHNTHTVTIASGATLKLAGGNNQLQSAYYPTAGTSAVVINGTLDASASASAHTMYAQTYTLNNGTITGGAGDANYGLLFFRANRTITANGASNAITCGKVGIGGGAALSELTLDTPLAGDLLNVTAYFGDATGPGGKLKKAGAGKVTLAGLNVHTGTTTVDAGTLEVTGSLRLRPTTNGAVNTIGGTGTLVLNGAGALNIDLTAANTTAGNSWPLVDAANLTESYGDAFTVKSSAGADFTETSAGSGVWKLTNGANQWTFTESNGTLTVGAASGYQSWIDSYVTITGNDKLPTADPDGDGLTNLDEFAFKGEPNNSGSRGLLAVSTVDANGDSVRELTLTVAARTGASFTGNPSPTATIDGVIYEIQGSQTLGSFTHAVTKTTTLTPAQTGLPDISGSGWTYQTFRLEGSEGLTGKGFLRAKATAVAP